jgi:hypothetical protein
MTDWTPGPWHEEPAEHRQVIVGSNGESVALTSGVSCTRANAALIAAAPELYEALHMIVWQWMNHPRQSFDGVIRVALPVLAKARGETP